MNDPQWTVLTTTCSVEEHETWKQEQLVKHHLPTLSQVTCTDRLFAHGWHTYTKNNVEMLCLGKAPW